MSDAIKCQCDNCGNPIPNETIGRIRAELEKTRVRMDEEMTTRAKYQIEAHDLGEWQFAVMEAVTDGNCLDSEVIQKIKELRDKLAKRDRVVVIAKGALERIRPVPARLLSGVPVRDLDETLGEVSRAIRCLDALKD